MSEVVGEAVIEVRTDESGVDTDGAGKRAGQGYTKGFSGALKGIGAAIGVAMAAGKVLDFAKASVGEAREAQKVGAATDQIIKATGGAAKITSAQIGDLAGAISAKSGIDDEAIQSGSNLLLTFKNVRNEAGKGSDVFNRATQAAVDLSAAGFGSIEGSSKMLGKALNDPLKGISALGRAGVTFTEQQKEQIKTMVESGDTLGAQKVIMKEVEGQVGGVAAATATSGEKMAVAWGNVQESVGGLLLPVLDKLANIFVTVIAPAIEGVIAQAGGLGPVFAQVGEFISSAFGGGSGEAVSSFFATIAAAAMTTLPLLRDLFVGQVLPAVMSLVGYFTANVLPIFQQIIGVVTGSVIPTFQALAAFVYGQLYPAFIAIVVAVATRLKPIFDTLIEVIGTSIIPTIQSLVNTFRTQLLPVLQPIIMRVVQVIGFLAKLAATILSTVIPPILRFAGFLIRNIVPAIAGVIVIGARIINFLLNLGAGFVRTIGRVVGFGAALAGLVRGGIAQVVEAVASLPGKVLALGGNLLNAGKSIMGKFLEGLKNAGSFASGIADAVWNAVRGVVNSAIDRINGLLDFSIKVGPKTFRVNAPNIGHLATGTPGWGGGMTWVGERGPELLNLPRGSQVWDANRSAAMSDRGQGDIVGALVQALAPFLEAMNRPNFTAVLPSGDPEAAAMAVMNRWTTTS